SRVVIDLVLPAGHQNVAQARHQERTRRAERLHRVEERQQLTGELLPAEGEELDHDDIGPELAERLQDRGATHALGTRHRAAAVPADEPPLVVEAERREIDEPHPAGTRHATWNRSAVQEDDAETLRQGAREREGAYQMPHPES